jgi:alpha-galactosidase
MAINTWACSKYGGVTTVGLCHGVQGAQWQIASCVEHWARNEGFIGPEEKVHRKDIDFVFSGINHQTWCVAAKWRSIDLIPRMLELFEAHPTYPTTEKVRIDVLRRFGYYSTESNGHLSEYLPWYRKRLDEINRWIDLSSWINGETGGYLRVCTEGRNWFETDFPNWMREEPPTFTPEKRSEEHGSYIIEALETGRIYRGHFNVPNRGYVPNLPDDCIVEVPGYVDRTGVNISVVGDLPLACAATCSASVRVQEMAMEAAVHGDAVLLKQAMLHDPLVGAVCDPEEVWQMTDDMLVAQSEWLPQYADEIPHAKERLADHERKGTRVKRMDGFTGMARLKTRSIEELSAAKEEARASASAADKGKMTQNA